MGDAEIIPIGTRGRPGRGTGSSSRPRAARNLAPAAPSRAPAEGRRPTPGEPEARPRRAPDARRPRRRAPRPPTARPATAPPPALARPRPPRDREPLAGHPGRRLAGGLPARRPRGLRRRSWEPQLAAFLAFLRRRVTGDYVVDEYGFDPEVTERFLMAALRPIAQKWFRIEVRGVENIPAEGGALVVSNHSGTIPVDGLMTMVVDPRPHRPLPAPARRRPGLPAAVRRRDGPQERRHAGLQRGRRADARAAASSSASGPRASRASASRTPSATSSSASAAAASSRRRCAPACRSCRCRWSAPRRSTRWSATCPSLARLLGVPVHPDHAVLPAARAARPGAAAVEVADRVRRADPHRRATTQGAADDPMLVFNVTDQVRETIQQTLYSLLMQRESVFR